MGRSKFRQIYENVREAGFRFRKNNYDNYKDFKNAISGTVSSEGKFDIRRIRLEVLPKRDIFDFGEYRDFHNQVADVIGLFPDNKFGSWMTRGCYRKKEHFWKSTEIHLGIWEYNEECGTLEIKDRTVGDRSYKKSFNDPEDAETPEEPSSKTQDNSRLIRLVRQIEVTTSPNVYLCGIERPITFKIIKKAYPVAAKNLSALFI